MLCAIARVVSTVSGAAVASMKSVATGLPISRRNSPMNGRKAIVGITQPSQATLSNISLSSGNSLYNILYKNNPIAVKNITNGIVKITAEIISARMVDHFTVARAFAKKFRGTRFSKDLF